MIEFLKQRKIVIIIGFLAIILVGWKIYDSSNFETIEKNEIISSDSKEEVSQEKQKKDTILVHIAGEVKNPGVVKVKEGSRIQDIIETAGGLTENADISNVNLAYSVQDGMKIRIPSNDDDIEKEEYITENSGKGGIMEENIQDDKVVWVNINTATQEELEKLPGIGASIATRIIDYRNQNGKFKNIEDIKNVTGIGDSKFAKIKDLIITK